MNSSCIVLNISTQYIANYWNGRKPNHSNRQYFVTSYTFFGTTFGTRKLFSKKIHPCGSAYNIATSACFIYLFPLKNLQSSYLAQWARTINRKRFFGTKRLLRRRFLQHYYRDTFIESHRKPTEVLEMSYSGRLIRR